MESNNKLASECFTIPIDLLIDVLRIVFRHNVKNEIVDFNDKENTVDLNLYLPQGSKLAERIRINIETFQQQYEDFLIGSFVTEMDDD
jgi:hypothetical protein